jgi:hypothetical protein
VAALSTALTITIAVGEREAFAHEGRAILCVLHALRPPFTPSSDHLFQASAVCDLWHVKHEVAFVK